MNVPSALSMACVRSMRCKAGFLMFWMCSLLRKICVCVHRLHSLSCPSLDVDVYDDVDWACRPSVYDDGIIAILGHLPLADEVG